MVESRQVYRLVPTNASFLVSENGSSSVGSNQLLSSISSQLLRRDIITNFTNFVDEIKNIHILDEYTKTVVNESMPSVMTKNLNTDFTLSSTSDIGIEMSDVQDRVQKIGLFRCNGSQDDCLNSESRPKLFDLRFQQPWSVRNHKFRLGLINSRECSSTLFHV